MFRWQFIITFTLLQMLFIGIITTVNYISMKQFNDSILNTIINPTTNLTAELINVPTSSLNFALLDNFVDEIMLNQNIAAIVITDTNKKFMSGKTILKNFSINQIIDNNFTLNQNYIYKEKTLKISDIDVGKLLLIFDVSNTNQLISNNKTITFAVILISLLVSTFFAYIFGKRITQKLYILKEYAQKISLNKEIEKIQFQEDDEFSILADEMFVMWQKISERNQKLLQSAAVFESIKEGIMITDSNIDIMNVNNAFTEITGYPKEMVLNKNPRILKSGRHTNSFYTTMMYTIIKNGFWRGEIWNKKLDGTLYPQWMTISAIKNEKGKITNYVSVFSDISEIKESEQKLEFIAHYDLLTKLPNKIKLHKILDDLIGESKKKKESFALLILDIDNFKNINDSYGHATGDNVILEIVKIIQNKILKNDDILARVGGDEFVIILKNIQSMTLLENTINDMLNILQIPISANQKIFEINFSIGVVLYPEHGMQSDELIKNADTAMHFSKENGKSQFNIYHLEMTEKIFELYILEKEIKKAIVNKEFFLMFQPQIDTENNQITNFEALIRWNHPQKGLLMPDYFIVFAERNNLIYPITQIVMELAFDTLLDLQKNYNYKGTLAINISSKDLTSKNFLSNLVSLVQNKNIDPTCIELEITETSLMDNPDNSIKVLNKLKDIGFKLSIDDFGTGYSSLSYLKKFPIDKIKIDREFVQDINQNYKDEAIIDSVISLSKTMNIKVIAEGAKNGANRTPLSF